MTSPFSLDIETGRVGPVNMPHDLCEVAQRGFHQQVVMVNHQTPCMNDGPVAKHGQLQVGEKLFPVALAFEYGLLFIAT